MTQFYLSNPALKAAGVQIPFTEDNIQEYLKCTKDPLYFIEHYCKIVSLDDGVVQFKLFPYQKRIIEALHNNKKVIGKLFRQSGKSTVVASYITWYVLFNDNKTAAILANKQIIAKEIFLRVQFMYENLPKWLQQGVVEWNKTSFSIENGSRCFCAATSASAVRGTSLSFLLCDEFAHLKPNLAEEFIASVFPTISSSETSKLAIISTPNGLNHFHKLWSDAEANLNGFIPVTGHWTEHPKRTQKWADDQLNSLGEIKFRQEILVTFEGSSYTLIDGAKLASIPTIIPLFQKDKLEIFKQPEKNHSYSITVDVSRGRHQDYSAFSVIDITKMPYEVVATFKDNTITTLEFPHLIYNIARQYNNAFILVEINDLGEEVSNTLWHDYEYENLYFTSGNELSQLRGYPGIRTTSKVKSLGCSVLKDLVEKDQLIINSHRIIEELGIFVLTRKTYAADNSDINDDLCTTLWLFAWLTKQGIFQDITNNDLRLALTEKKQEYIDSTMTPFGFYDDGQNIIDKQKLDMEENKIIPEKDKYYLTSDQIELLNL
jgi:hypothetical protein